MRVAVLVSGRIQKVNPIGDFIKNNTRLNEEKRLHPAELGWAQVLSYPYGLNHRSFLGWVQHDKKILDVFLKEQDR